MLDNFMIKEPDADTMKLIVDSGSLDIGTAFAAQAQLAKALELPLRQGVLVGDIVTQGIFQPERVAPGASIEYPLDLLAPGEEADHVATTNPGNGRIPERQVEGDYVMIPTYGIMSSIDWLLRFAREARYSVVARALRVLQASFVKKINDDGWHTILSAAADRSILVFDADASAGQFTKRLISLMSNIMVRNGGGNTASIRRSKLTDLYFSPEGLEGIRNWGLDQVDEMTRREIFLSQEGTLTRVFNVNLHDLVEFGDGHEYQNYFINQLSGALASSDLELVVGLDLLNNDSFVMPIKQDVTVYPDPMLHRQQREGYYGTAELGFGVLDNRRAILGSF